MAACCQDDIPARAFAVAAEARRLEAAGQEYSLSNLARQHGTTLNVMRQYPQLLKRTKPGKSLRVTAHDSYVRFAQIYIPLAFRDGDVRTVRVHSYEESQLASKYTHTIDLIKRGKLPPDALREFEGVTFGKEKQPVLTSRIERLLDAGITITEFGSGQEPAGGAE